MSTLTVNPKDYRYPVDICLCWHHKLDHGEKGCTVCGQCYTFRKPPVNQIMTAKRVKYDRTISEKMRELKAANSKLTDEVARLKLALEKSGLDCTFKNISTCLSEFEAGRLTKNKFCGGCMRREALKGEIK